MSLSNESSFISDGSMDELPALGALFGSSFVKSRVGCDGTRSILPFGWNFAAVKAGGGLSPLVKPGRAEFCDFTRSVNLLAGPCALLPLVIARAKYGSTVSVGLTWTVLDRAVLYTSVFLANATALWKEKPSFGTGALLF